MSSVALTIGFAVFGYLFGSVSTAVVICRALGLPDPRGEGSGNPGATNVLRIGGRVPAALTLVGDFLKGTLPVLITRAVTDDMAAIALVGWSAFAGHLYPIFFGFRGGKGVATGLGVLLGWSWLAVVLTGGSWLLMAMLTRLSSFSALLAFLLAPSFLWWTTHSVVLVGTMAIMTLMLYWRHRSNIANLVAGKEKKIEL
ncbi:MAG: glycerol-3-phosphate 1-O-acyltransferase PlsY [Nitrococcus mobilis]|nr:glycerol-3-phosphate 1-O-acyltransferase PlsY [Nitrococcus mobilis]